MTSNAELTNLALFCDFENIALGVRDARYAQFDINRVLERAVRAGYLVRITASRFLHKAAFIELTGKAETLAASSADKLFDAAAFRDTSNLGRGISIELLEHFDRIGFTQRVGDRRRLLKPAAAALEADRFESRKTTR